MDFTEGLLVSDGTNVILVVVDYLIMYAHFIPRHHPYTAHSVSKLYIDQVVCLHGVPFSIISDRDTIFTSHVWCDLFKAVGTTLQYSIAHHPQTDGQSECVNQCLEQYLRCAMQDRPQTWRRCLPMAEFWYNLTHHSALGCSTFRALYKMDPNFGGMPNIAID